MSNNEIDYSNTIIYKITCKDIQVTDVYVGHTINFVQRKSAHKQSCMNIKNTNYNCKVYKVIRAHGGWSNWSMDIINFFNCKDQHAARIKEQEYFISLNATLNSIEPFPQPKVVIPSNNVIIDETLLSGEPSNTQGGGYTVIQPHSNQIINNESVIKHQKTEFYCEKCDYSCRKKSDYIKHSLTRKHKKNTCVDKIQPKTNQVLCSCGKQYTHRASLFNHKKKCTTDVSLLDEPENDKILVKNLTAMVMELLKSNSELQKHLVEDLKKNNNGSIEN